MFFTIYVRIDGADADERAINTAAASAWVKTSHGVEAKCLPYGLSIQVSGTSMPEARSKGTVIAAALSRQDNVVAVSRTDPVAEAKAGSSRPWPGALDAAGPQASSPAPNAAITANAWGPLTARQIKVIEVLAAATHWVPSGYLQRAAGVSQSLVSRVLRYGIAHELIETMNAGNSTARYRISTKGRQVASSFITTTNPANDES